MSYLLQHSSDLKTWANLATVTASAGGVCTSTVTVVDSAYFRYAYETPVP